MVLSCSRDGMCDARTGPAPDIQNKHVVCQSFGALRGASRHAPVQMLLLLVSCGVRAKFPAGGRAATMLLNAGASAVTPGAAPFSARDRAGWAGAKAPTNQPPLPQR